MAPHIMVVNDTQEILELFREILTEEGYEVSLYSYGMQDVQEVERRKPDLVILDYLMYREDPGWQMLQKMKMSKATASIPIIICTTSSKAIQEMQGHLIAKGVAVVLKPFDIYELIAAVERALGTIAQGVPSIDDSSDETSN